MYIVPRTTLIHLRFTSQLDRDLEDSTLGSSSHSPDVLGPRVKKCLVVDFESIQERRELQINQLAVFFLIL